MNILLIGDVVAQSGVEFLQKKLGELKNKYKADITVVNGENSADGNGITKLSARGIISAGADVITTGNHCFQRNDCGEVFENEYIIRPANYPVGNVGEGFCILDTGRTQIAVLNVMGTSFLDPLDNPFSCVEKLLEKIDTKNIFVDFHAESTAEKQAMGYFLEGKVTAVAGTHTHVQTADEKILPGGTAYISDLGMTGVERSVLGKDIKPALNRFLYRTPSRLKEAEGKCFMCGVCINFDEKTGKALKIERFQVR